MFYVAQAFLIGQGLTFSKHGSLLSAVGQHLVKPGVIPAHLHRNLIAAYNARIEGDYEPGGKFTEQDAALRIAQAEEFITVAEENSARCHQPRLKLTPISPELAGNSSGLTQFTGQSSKSATAAPFTSNV